MLTLIFHVNLNFFHANFNFLHANPSMVKTSVSQFHPAL